MEAVLSAGRTQAQKRWIDDAWVILMTGTLAGCGLVYEYLLASAAGRILGAIETVIYAMIGVMIVSMGAGAFCARLVRQPFTGFAWLEGSIAILGGASVLLMGAITAGVSVLPQAIATAYSLPPDLAPSGAAVAWLQRVAEFVPYMLGALLGFLVGMEIPLLARVRQSFHAGTLEHNTGTIYGADYVGAGVGAAIWIVVMLSMDPVEAAWMTAAVNLGVGTLFLLRFRAQMGRAFPALLGLHMVAGLGLAGVAREGPGWARAMEDMLYADRVVHAFNTEHQRVAVTRRTVHAEVPPVHTLYLNGRLQFSSSDEQIYHSFLTFPALAAAPRRDHVLVIGGGDGLAVRDILRWNPQSVTLLELDPEVVAFFSEPRFVEGRFVNRDLLDLNGLAFADPRVEKKFGDAYLAADDLLREGRRFDAVIVDLPDPGHPDIARLYSVRFYTKLRLLLSADGALAVQSTSPYMARDAFLTIARTVAEAGFAGVDQYMANVPSMGQWGWTAAVLSGPSVRERLERLEALPVDDGFMTRELLLGAFAFPKGFFRDREDLRASRLHDPSVYTHYRRAWREVAGIGGGR